MQILHPSSGIRISRFHGRRGEAYGLWYMRLLAASRVKVVWNVDVNISKTSNSSYTEPLISTLDTSTSIRETSYSRLLSEREKVSTFRFR